MNNRLFVGNLPYPADAADLKKIFSRVGLVAKTEIIKDRHQQSRGFGFVTMSNQSEAQSAVNKLNGYTLNVSGAERNLFVKEATS